MKRLIWNRHTKIILKHTLGWICILAGTVMLITPGQGILTILIGVYLLADHVPAFGRLKIWLQGKFPKATDYIHRKGEHIKARFHHGEEV
jgi:hypothetical protein